ncbi:MAG: hypothetical protein KF718_05275 [Polyangiaceae bacterium]|nr:hypothetical protein [Polyangiaceae bacterium]
MRTPRGWALDTRVPILAAAAAAEPATLRTDFVATYSRLTNVVSVVGGRAVGSEAALNDVVSFRDGEPPLHVQLTRSLPPVLQAATYSARHARVWVLGHQSAPGNQGKAQWSLLRVNPATGEVDEPDPLPELQSYERAWLRTTAEGRIVVVATRRAHHVVLLVDVEPFRDDAPLRRLGKRPGTGEVVSLPLVRDTRVSAGIAAVRAGKPVVVPRHLADLGRLPAMLVADD